MAEYEIVGSGPLPGLDLTAAQVAGQVAPAPVAPVLANLAPAALRAPARDDKGELQFFSVRQADGSAAVVDTLGRVLVVKKLTIVERMRLFKICGPDGSRNPAYFGHAATAGAVQTINGAALPSFTNEAGLERVVAQLDDAGIEAASAALSFLMKEGAADQTKVLDAAKN